MKKTMNQSQNVTQIVKIAISDLKPKRKKRKKRKSIPKRRHALDVAKTGSYEFKFITPTYPSVINIQRERPSMQTKLENSLRNYASINTAELKRLRGDLVAYRQEAQTNFKTNVAFPKATVNVGDLSRDLNKALEQIDTSPPITEPQIPSVPQLRRPQIPQIPRLITPDTPFVQPARYEGPRPNRGAQPPNFLSDMSRLYGTEDFSNIGTLPNMPNFDTIDKVDEPASFQFDSLR